MGLNDAKLDEVKASARRYLNDMREHTTCCGVPMVRAMLEELIALEVAVAACVDGGTFDMVVDALQDCEAAYDGDHSQIDEANQKARAVLAILNQK